MNVADLWTGYFKLGRSFFRNRKVQPAALYYVGKATQGSEPVRIKMLIDVKKNEKRESTASRATSGGPRMIHRHKPTW
jgi:hypothetical protein